MPARSINGYDVPAPRDNAAARALIREILSATAAHIPSRCVNVGEQCSTCPMSCTGAGMTSQQIKEDAQ